MRACFMRSRGFDDVTLDDLPSGWPVPRVGEAVVFTTPALSTRKEPTWLVLDVLYTYAPNITTPVIVIKLHPEG
jgi:hypothetical protein